ncbi:UDP-N-acetylenolpyruvoylglucosamine reductase MurB [Gimesia panareensis]|uniref:UDP-N-acetylenolpyruvoylglucosamine reductase n=1 Tax=Gimesia panareensis TaxID=2527978 RepID=A0A518FL69_9PLAN|nr:FAD-binding protein [Gimesia panareensis]QDV17101.1 UDP-N-acetylenolpyruvoylglucosamine reductase MurB [Gimesia panareensis]
MSNKNKLAKNGTRLNVRECDLKELTTLQLGGRAEIYTPQDLNQFVDLLKAFHQQNQCYHVLGNGSNLLVNDDQLEIPVVHTKLLNGIRFSPPFVEVEAGYLMPKLVNDACSFHLGGIEYLASIPGTIGGGVCMNAGRGKSYNKSIHQRIVSVRIFDGNKERYIKQNDLKSDYRWSLFREESDMTILSVVLRLEFINPATIRKRIIDRIRFAHHRQDHSAPNAGSVFRVEKNFGQLKGRKIGNACFSSKTCNWILNEGASFKDMMDLILSAGTITDLEWVVWSE